MKIMNESVVKLVAAVRPPYMVLHAVAVGKAKIITPLVWQPSVPRSTYVPATPGAVKHGVTPTSQPDPSDAV